ncbi:Short chain dehydrogenase andC [Lachnellula arida]|uniref:Short chain dehydrogenase andC n=1 Tax=Lachnellula arida TaxID=1316785 RepID=A0A8T9B9Y0_9HELO|nr:Short chain dehydrogenase andC [Lachnellula arida]
MSFSYHNSNTILPQRTIDPAGFGKVAIITGCASGVGLATTQLFLAHNYEVTGVDMHDIDYAKIDERDQGRFHFHKGDLVEPGECDEVVRICVAKYGRQKIDVLANIAGILDAYAAADVFTDREWERVLMVNLTVPTRMMRAVLPFMKANGGSIVNVASKAAVSGAAAGVAYTASKHGLVSAVFIKVM